MTLLKLWAVERMRCRPLQQGTALPPARVPYQVLWWNDYAGKDPYNPNNPFQYGNWYGGRILSVSSKTGNLKVKSRGGR